tara:strand:- start:687 stop:977 length:291 start_codon:yes stop_codon:yes gene_type:complete
LYKENYVLFESLQQTNILNFEKYIYFIKKNLYNIYKIFNLFQNFNKNYILYHFYFIAYKNLITYSSTINGYIKLETYSTEPFFMDKLLFNKNNSLS